MKRSRINQAYKAALSFFQHHGWHLPPNPKWDITDFGLGNFDHYGRTLINLAEDPEYCEKLMYAHIGQITPAHTHRQKKEDIICRVGTLQVELWPTVPRQSTKGDLMEVKVNGQPHPVRVGTPLRLPAGERVTLTPGIYHSFSALSAECIIGEVSTANDDKADNIFADPNIGRFPEIEEDEPPLVRLIGESSHD